MTRVICKQKDGYLIDVLQTHNIEKIDGKVETGDRKIDLVVSMNMWGLYPEIFDKFGGEFNIFLSQLSKEYLKSKYLLSIIIGDLLHKLEVNVKVIKSNDECYDVTYKEDNKNLYNCIYELIEKGGYPDSL